MRRLQWLSIAVIALATLVVFEGTRHGGFLRWDDDINIVGNRHLDALSWENLHWMFTDASHMRRYVPLAWLGWAVEHVFFGLTPTSAHIGNIVLHAVNSVLVFLVLQRLLAAWPATRSLSPSSLIVASLAGALLWAVHPLRTEVVAWASGRMYCQAALFFFAALLAYLRGAQSPFGSRPHRVWIGLSALAFGASLLSYPIALMLPVALLVIDHSVLRRFDPAKRWHDPVHRPVWLEKLPFFAIAVAVGGATLVARWGAQGVWQPPPTLAEFGIGARLMQACYVWLYYVWKPLFPSSLAPAYPTLVDFNPTSAIFILSAMGLVGTTAVLIWRRGQWPAAWALWVAHLLLLAPMLGLTERPHYANDRYSYLEGLLWSAAAAGIFLVAQRRLRSLALAPAVALLAALATSAWAQTRIWQNSETLFRHVYTLVAGTSYRADIAFRLGDEMRQQGRSAEATKLYQESLQIVANSSRSAIPHFGLATLAHAERRWQDAANHYQAAVQLDPNLPEALAEYGKLLVEVGQPANALPLLARAAQLQPGNASVRAVFGVALFQAGKTADALEHFRVAAQLQPTAAAFCNLAAALCAVGRPADAIEPARAAVRLDPNSADAHLKLGDALRLTGQFPAAIAEMREAARLGPTLPALWNGLGTTCASAGQIEDAAAAFAEAVRLDPTYIDGTYNLGLALRDLKRPEQAAAAFTTVLKLKPDHAPARQELARLHAR